MSLVSKKQYRLMVELFNSRSPESLNNKKEQSVYGVGVLVIHPETGHVLVGKCSKTGKWSTPGGHVDKGETPREAAARELKEETGIKVDPETLSEKHNHGSSITFAVTHDGEGMKDTKELKDLKFTDPSTLDQKDVRDCCSVSLKQLEKNQLNKNVNRAGQVAYAVHELTHGDALKLVGNAAFRKLKNEVDGMKSDSIKDIKFGGYTLHIRKHVNDVYSGRIDDGLKTIHQFVNKSLPSLTADIMSVFEWYSDKDDEKFEVEEEDKLSDEVVHSGMKKLIDNYRNYNIADIYDEMESIREEIRHGNARDLQQAEQKIMSLFDKLEEQIQYTKEKHNSLARRSGDELDKLEEKLKSLAERVSNLSDKASSKKEKVEATIIGDEMPNHKKVHNDFYPYLSKPTVSILPNGVINITFGTDWMTPEKENFLTDMKAKALKKGKK